MFKFKLLDESKYSWEVHLKSNKELTEIYSEEYETDEGTAFFGITEYLTSKLYINKDIDGYLLIKTLRHELMHIYLWENDNNNGIYDEDEICETISYIAPIICEKAEEIFLKIKKERGKSCEQPTREVKIDKACTTTT